MAIKTGGFNMETIRKGVTNEEMSTKLPYIIAVDFDGTLVDDNYPYIGGIKWNVWRKLEEARNNGAKIVLWTCRDGVYLHEAVEFCKSNGLGFDSVNENLREVQELFNNDTRKVYADEYWDDKSIQAFSTIPLTRTRGTGEHMKER